MPNYKLTPRVCAHITAMVLTQVDKRTHYAEANFPLTPDEVQAAVIAPNMLERMMWLEKAGVENMEWLQSNPVFVSLLDTYIPGLERDALVSVVSPRLVYVSRRCSIYGYHANKWASGYEEQLRLDAGVLTDAARERLVAWVGAAVREHRLKRMVCATAKAVLEMSNSTAQLLSWWPALASLVTDNDWRGKFRSPPKKVERWAPGPALVAKYAKRIEAADVILNGALLMPDFEHPKGAVRATIVAWQPLEKDPSF